MWATTLPHAYGNEAAVQNYTQAGKESGLTAALFVCTVRFDYAD